MTRYAAKYLARHRHQLYEKILRVNHAGELGADRIYCGQMAALRLKNPAKAAVVQKMWDQEKEHLRTFNVLLLKNRVRKSYLTPFWNVGAFSLGFFPSLLGYQASMAVTVAVEKVIVDHYEQQLRQLMADDPVAHKELIDIISKFRDDEQHHHDTGYEHDAKQAPFYKGLTALVSGISKVAIKVAEKV